MDALQPEEQPLTGSQNAPQGPLQGKQQREDGGNEPSPRHASPMQKDGAVPTEAEMLAKRAEIQSLMRQRARHDSVLSNVQGGFEKTIPSGKPVGLGSSILRMPSVTSAAGSTSNSPKSSSISHDKKAVDSTFLIKYGKEWWPIILCDDKTAPSKFIQTRHDSSHLPAILLGKRIYIWVRERDLEVFDPSCDYLRGAKKLDTDNVLSADDTDDKNEKLRQKAYRTDMFHVLERDKDNKFFMNAIEQVRHVRHFEQLLEDESKSAWRRRYRKERMRQSVRQDLENDRHHQRKRKFEMMLSSSESSDDDKTTHQGSSDGEASSLFVKRRRWSADVGATSSGEQQRLLDGRQRQIRENCRSSFENMKGWCTIYMGSHESGKSFRVPNNTLVQSAVLAGMMKRSDGPDPKSEDTRINLREAFKVKAKHFQVVVTYLVKGSFSPHIVKGRRGRPVIEGLNTEQDVRNAAAKFAKTYLIASHIDIHRLQRHCIEKLACLPAVDPQGIITVFSDYEQAKKSGQPAEAEMEEWLIDRISETWAAIAREEGETLNALLATNERVMRGVGALLARGSRDR